MKDGITFHSIEQVPAVAEKLRPLTDEQRRAVEDATRYERVSNYVKVLNYRRLITPIHKRCQ